MTDPNDYTKTIYLVVTTRFSNVSKDCANFIIPYESKDEAEKYAEEILSGNRYNCLHFAVSVIPMSLNCANVKYANLSGCHGYTDAKFDIKTSAVNPISTTQE